MSPAPSKAKTAAAQAAANAAAGDDNGARSRKRARNGTQDEAPTPTGGVPQTPTNQYLNGGQDHGQPQMMMNGGGGPNSDPSHPSNQNGGLSRPASSASNHYLSMGGPPGSFNPQDQSGRSPQPPLPPQGYTPNGAHSPQLHISIPPGMNGGAAGFAGMQSGGPDSSMTPGGSRPFAGAPQAGQHQPPPSSTPQGQVNNSQPTGSHPSPLDLSLQQLDRSSQDGSGLGALHGLPGSGAGGGMDPSVFGGGVGGADMFADLDMGEFLNFDMVGMDGLDDVGLFSTA